MVIKGTWLRENRSANWVSPSPDNRETKTDCPRRAEGRYALRLERGKQENLSSMNTKGSRASGENSGHGGHVDRENLRAN